MIYAGKSELEHALECTGCRSIFLSATDKVAVAKDPRVFATSQFLHFSPEPDSHLLLIFLHLSQARRRGKRERPTGSEMVRYVPLVPRLIPGCLLEPGSFDGSSSSERLSEG